MYKLKVKVLKIGSGSSPRALASAIVELSTAGKNPDVVTLLDVRVIRRQIGALVVVHPCEFTITREAANYYSPLTRFSRQLNHRITEAVLAAYAEYEKQHPAQLRGPSCRLPRDPALSARVSLV